MGKTFKDQPSETKWTKNKKSRKNNKEKSIKLRNQDIDAYNRTELVFQEVTEEELESRRSSTYEYFKFDEDENS